MNGRQSRLRRKVRAAVRSELERRFGTERAALAAARDLELSKILERHQKAANEAKRERDEAVKKVWAKYEEERTKLLTRLALEEAA